MSRITEDDMPRKIEPNQSIDAGVTEPTQIDGPIFGAPSSEVIAWVKSWGTDKEFLRPKVRRIR